MITLRTVSATSLLAFVVTCDHNDAKPTSVAPPPVSYGAGSKGPALFSYEEDGVTLSFWSPSSVRVTRLGGKPCDSELPDKGNMWSGPDVEAAFRAAEVQAVLTRSEVFRSNFPIPSKIIAAARSITWVIAWKELPPAEPPSVQHLQQVLHGVTLNLSSMCT